MKVLSLFDGISCGMLALQRAGIPVECYDAFEIDKYAVTVSKHNYPDIVHHGDVFDGDFTKFKGYDLLLGGSPCTYWSIAKKGRETTSDGMGFKLFMEYVRALKESECRYFLYENNYSIHQNIKDEISKHLGVQPIMINSALLSAQNRKRCYWTNIPNVTQPEDKGIMLADVLENAVPWQDKSYCITSSYNGAVLYNTLERKQRTMVAIPINTVGGKSHTIADARQRVFEELDGKLCHDKLTDKFVRLFQELKEKAERCNDVAALKAITSEADALKLRCLNEINEMEIKLTPVTPPPVIDGGGNGDTPPVAPPPAKPVKKRKSVSIKTINNATTWQIETEEDVKKYVAELEKRLIATLEDNTVINIEF